MAPDVDTVVIGASWYHYFSQTVAGSQYVFEDGAGRIPLALDPETTRRVFASLGNCLGRLARNGKKVYLILDPPFGKELDPKYIVRRSLWRGFEIRTSGLDQRRFTDMTTPTADALRKVARENAAILIDPVLSLCDGSICPALTSDGYPKYRDSIHLLPVLLGDSTTYLDPTFEP